MAYGTRGGSVTTRRLFSPRCPLPSYAYAPTEHVLLLSICSFVYAPTVAFCHVPYWHTGPVSCCAMSGPDTCCLDTS
eukprot:3738718-Rhodomonas_salina.2